MVSWSRSCWLYVDCRALGHSESRTYYSRDAEGTVLYKTHHFTSDELRALLLEAGLEAVEVIAETETSSRRKSATANFLYVVATASTRSSQGA